ncbi:Leucine-rich repeat receptor-like protein kinase PXC1 [Sesamum alatum]|uniref:Leucine-rich repeat receptor-like protein kinase PXC1 n=1 Tax=Sesamum alatum TaxID=300844 RepID=A0AAE2CD52_9LAMI|nr:Leucine-rich repeat receptor-like protein kinase PXC1 [Sesamum alatum]
MKQIPIWACLFSLFLLIHTAESYDDQARNALVEFISKLSNNRGIPGPTSGWNDSSHPCKDRWRGITCDNEQLYVKEIALDGLDFSGVLDARLLCNVHSLSASLLVINVTNNSIHGDNMEDIKNCFQLSHLIIGWNQFSGNLPKSISQLKKLEVLDVSHNKFSGPLPESLTPGLKVFLAQDNQFNGDIPGYDFSSLSEFNVSYNNLSGAIPDAATRFKMSSFIYNLHLCGPPLPKNCTHASLAAESAPAPPPKFRPVNGGSSSSNSKDQILMFAGYVVIGFAILLILLLCVYKRCKRKDEKLDLDHKVAAVDDSMTKPSFSTVELKAGGVSKTEFSTASAESATVSASVIIMTSPERNGLRFEDLLKSPAELLGRGQHGSMYKVTCEGQDMTLVVKRIKDWPISSSEFRQRMRRLNQVKHPNVLSLVAYYSSREERLLVYEYQQNGSLFRLIHSHGNRTGQPFNWSSRLSVAAKVADALAFMHEELHYDRIPHGNLKSSNVLLNKDMEPCISEYGLMVVGDQDQTSSILTNSTLEAAQEESNSLFKADTHAFGVILLELLTGRMALHEGLDLASWVLAVVSEEWTVEVFDKNLIHEGASEERMVNVLQIAIKCVNKSPEARPSMKQVALEMAALREENERSIDVSELSMSRSFIDV